MSKQETERKTPETEAEETVNPETEAKAEEASDSPNESESKQREGKAAETDPMQDMEQKLAAKEDQFLRLAAEYDNFRRRSAKEKSDAYSKAKADAALAFLPVYDNLERALKQGSSDEAFVKGVEMTMTQLLSVLEGLGIKPIDALGKPFDPNFHNAVMHVEDESLGENTVAQVFQTGFIMGDKVIRFAMVQVAN